MTASTTVAPLRIANEAFMVASTIERCPRTMMLRELVMNAMEAASGASGEKRVRIGKTTVGGVPKLRIWNTGRGLSADELLTVTDLSSSLFKTVSLDGNFGMGAKTASLTSNRHGLRYRSCREGRVSEVVLGQRGGVYGRLIVTREDGAAAEVIDVTESCRAAGAHLGADWTEVTLLGNAAEQNTVLAPYGGAPETPPDWVLQTLAKRFVHLPSGVNVHLETETDKPEVFEPSLGASRFFDQSETVATSDGVRIRYCYRAEDSAKPRPRVRNLGLGAITFGDEVYACVEGPRWLLEAPTYGLTFAGRRCTILVELPRSFPVVPEQYRQFLRFKEGEQRQVAFADFGELVRQHMPAWLKRIIQSLTPEAEDYLDDIKANLADLLAQLGIEDWQWRAKPEARATPRKAPEENRQSEAAADLKPPPKDIRDPARPTPPEIIVVDTDEQIAEKALGGRAARYYPTQRQLFVNARYEAFARLSAWIGEEFEANADAETIQKLSRQAAEWTLIERLARTLVHSLGKAAAGWSEDDVKSVQSPETMSLVIDDVEMLQPAARRRLARLLGVETGETGAQAGGAGIATAQHSAMDLAAAEAKLQQAMAANIAHVGYYYAQVAIVLLKQRKFDQAGQWLEKGVAADPDDPWCYHERAGLLVHRGDFAAAAMDADAALARAGDAPGEFLRRRAVIEAKRGNPGAAIEMLEQASRRDPANPWLPYDISTLQLAQNAPEAALEAISRAIKLDPASPTFLRGRAAVESRLGDRKAARATLEAAVALSPADLWANIELASLLSVGGDHDAASAVLDATPSQAPLQQAQVLRTRSDIERRRGNLAQALAAASAACEAHPADPSLHEAHANLLITIGELDAAEKAVDEAERLMSVASPSLHRIRGAIASRRGDSEAARRWLGAAIDADRTNPWTWYDYALVLMRAGDLPAADAAAAEACKFGAGQHAATFLRLRSDIALRAKDIVGARRWIEQALAADPNDASVRMAASSQALAASEFAGAMDQLEAALARSRAPDVWMLRRGFEIERRRGDFDGARKWLDRAITAHPKRPEPYLDLSNLLSAMGDFHGAQIAAETALSLRAPEAP